MKESEKWKDKWRKTNRAVGDTNEQFRDNNW